MRAATSAPYTDLNYVATTEHSDYIYMLDAHGAIASTQKYNAQADMRTSARRIPTLRATQSSEGAATGVTAGLVGSIIEVAGGYPIIGRDTQLYITATDGWASGKGPTAARRIARHALAATGTRSTHTGPLPSASKGPTAARPIGRHALAATVPRVFHAPAFRACFQAPTCLPHSSTLRVRLNGSRCCTLLAARSQPPWSRILCTHPTFFQGPFRRQVTPVSPPARLPRVGPCGLSPARRARRPAPPTGCGPHRCAHADGAQEWLLGVGRQQPVRRWHGVCALAKP
jgi:hypothetical protein